MTPDEAAKHLRVSRATIYKWCKRGLLPYYELPSKEGRRFKVEDLDKLARPGQPDQAAEER